MKRPLLSVVLTGRNDNYLGNFKYRITTALNMLGESVAELGREDDIEVLVVDWNSEVPLYKELRLLPSARKITRFVMVPPELAQAKSSLPCDPNIGSNCGIRRAAGEYMIFIPADIVILAPALHNLLALLEGRLQAGFDCRRTFLAIQRKLIPWVLVEQEPGVAELRRYLQISTRNIEADKSYIGICGGYGGFLMHRELWFGLRGTLEGYDGWGWTDIELGLRVNKKYPMIDPEAFGIFFYDMQQAPDLEKEKVEREGSMRPAASGLVVNPEDWGLGRENLEIVAGVDSRTAFPPPAVAAGISVPAVELGDENLWQELGLKEEPVVKRVLAFSKVLHRHVREEDTPLLLLLAAIRRRLPWRRVLIVGLRKLIIPVYLNFLDETSEIYAIDQLGPEDFIPYHVSLFQNLKILDFKGFVQCVSGPMESAFSRFIECLQFLGGAFVELIIVDCDAYREVASLQPPAIAAFLEREDKAAVLVFFSRDGDYFRQVVGGLQEEAGSWRRFLFPEQRLGCWVPIREVSVAGVVPD